MVETEKIFYCGTIEVAQAIVDVLIYLGIDYTVRIVDGEAELIVSKED